MAGILLRCFIVFFIFTDVCAVPSAAAVQVPKIKVLIVDETNRVVPEKDEQLQRLGNMKGELLMNGAHYSGTIEVWKSERGLYVVNEILLEEYIKSVVAAEVGTNWEYEALRAQAVIARTYAVFRMKASGSSRYHITSTVLHQVYRGDNTETLAALAVRETAGEILTYEGRPVEAFYHSTAGGMTEDPAEVFGKSYPYLRPVETCGEQSPYWIWERKIAFEEISRALNVKDIRSISVGSLTSTKRVKEVVVSTDEGEKSVPATELRKLLGWSRLPSTNFRLTTNGDSVKFEGKGYGHGVGLCQWSALQMARDGKTYREILSYFYPGTEIRIYEGR